MANKAPFPCPSAAPCGTQALAIASKSGLSGRLRPVTFVTFPTGPRIAFDSLAVRLHGMVQAKGEHI
jgi:hypothetical protein